MILSVTSVFGFTFTATPTPESCAGNGTITFTNANQDPNGTILYVVYKLPDTTTPYATVSSNFINGLSSGTYRIIAKETVGATSTEQQLDVVINNTIVALSYSVQSLNLACSNTSNISVTTLTGVAVTYEIFSGPVLFPIQSTNTFNNLPVGVYKIRVFDNCGIGVVQTFTVNQNTAGINIGQPTFSNTSPPSCNFTIATNIITPSSGTVLGYPLAITYTVNPPGGGTPIVSNTNLLSGNPTSQSLVATLPDYVNQTYNYDITITDACNSTYTQNFIVNQNITLTSNIVVLDCNQNYFELGTTNFTPPFTLNFTTVPAGFNPTGFNANYPGPYNQNVVPFGSANNTVPLGLYSVTITDSCGRTTTRTFSIVLNPPIPTAVGTNNGCLFNSGTIVVTIPSFTLVSATILVAPASYPNPLPFNVSSSIVNGILTLNPVPLGDYTIQIADNCNSVLAPINCTVPIYVDKGLSVVVRPGCDLQKTSLELSSNNGKLITVAITNAPAGFTQTLPFVISNYIITNGKLYLNDLPAGNYTFTATDECNFTNTTTITAAGYAITTNTFSLQPNCGSFNIPLNFVSNGTVGQSFWLQKQINAAANTWGHPGTSILYTDGTVPTATNSLALINGTTNFNLSYNGTFRIVRKFISYNDGVSINNGLVAGIDKDCIEILSPIMTFNEALEIIDASRIPCTANGNLDVVVAANGTVPLNYTITTKDGLPFFINNGTSNIFYNLPSGVYTFQVEDVCGNIVNRIFDVSTLMSLVTITQPITILQCKAIITGNETFDITQQNATILGSQSASNYTLTYYTSLIDAQNAVNPIVNLSNFNPINNPQAIYARLVFNALPNCYEVRTFDLIVGQIPTLNLQPEYLNCTVIPIDIDASANNLVTTTYLWSNGATTPLVTISQLGTTNLTVTATNSYGNPVQTCTTTKNISVTISELPQIDHFETIDWTANENTITVFTTNNGDFEYSLDNTIFQSSNSFTNLLPGVYMVYVRDRKGCGITQKQVWLLYYLKYFTPNGDGFHERWRIENSQYENNLKVLIYDRYGKFMTALDAQNLGWDGTYNGELMFSSDYWFVVYRQDGRVHKGHFTLKR